MKTLTATQARQNFGSARQRAIRGEGEAVALHPVKVYSKDYAWQEYGVTAAELARAEAKEWDGTVQCLKT